MDPVQKDRTLQLRLAAKTAAKSRVKYATPVCCRFWLILSSPAQHSYARSLDRSDTIHHDTVFLPDVIEWEQFGKPI